MQTAPAAQPVRRPSWGLRLAGHRLTSLILRRVALGVLTLLAVSVLIFLATNVLPGNVAEVVLGKNATPASAHALGTRLGLDRPLATRYLDWLGGFAHGDLGQSAVAVSQAAPQTQVAGLIKEPLFNSLVLAVLAGLLLVPLSLLVGVVSAVKQGRATDRVVSYVSLILGSLPEFVLGVLLILVFSTQLDVLPPVSLLGPGQSPLSQPSGLVLPVLTLVGVALAFTSRQVRAGMIVELRQDYVLMARLNGIPEATVLRRYALRNALAACVQTFAQALQYLFGGVIVVEALFTYPGIGTVLAQAVARRDVTEVAGIAIVLAAAYIAINIIADIVVILLVPKLRTGVR